MAELRELLIDPFVDDNVDEPRRVEYSVPGLNEGVADRVIAETERLQSQPRPRYQARAPKTLFIASRQPGFGKSHLIGKLFRRLNGKATLVYLRPFEDPDTCWKSILIRIVQELDFPDRFPQTAADEHPTSQLELFAHGVLSQIVADHLESENRADPSIPMLRQPPEKLADLMALKLWKALSKRAFSDDKWIAQVEHQLRGHGLSLRTSISTWLKVLYGYTYLDDDWGLARACLDWIQGDPIDDEEAKRIGMRLADRPRGDMTAGELNELAKGRIQDLCRLAGFFRPFLFCFDQTETYGKSSELARCLGRVIIDLTNEAYNQLTLMTANVDPWEKKLRPHWEQASLNRLSTPLMLDTLSLKQGVALAEQRLSQYEQGEPKQRRFWGDRAWLEALFRDQKEMGVRLFLNKCSTRWQQVIFDRGDEFRPPLEGLFHRYQDQISTQERRLVFDRDALYWLVYELAVGLEGLEVDKASTKRLGKAPRWHHGERTFIFYLDPSSFWRHWEEIANTVLKEDAASKPVFVCPRTPELEPIPKPSWKAIGPKVQAATASRLCLLPLGRQEMVRLYAAQDLYSDAVQGDIAWSPDEVAHFLRKALTEFWQSILAWQGDGSKPPPAPSIPKDLARAITRIVDSRKFLSLDELLSQLPGEPDRGTVLGICGEIPQIRVHTAPNTTLVQWQSAK